MINRQLVHYDTAGQRVIIQPGDLTNVGGDVYAISPGGAVTSVADVPNTIPVRDADGGFEVGYLQIDTTPPVVETDAVGKIIWNDTDGTLEFGAKGGNVVIQIGQEEVVRVKNDTGGALTAGEVVYISGSSGVNLLAKLADATSEATSSETIGIVTEPIASSNNGFVTTFGLVRNINTLHLTEGAAVWLSTTAGQTTSTRPTAPNHGVLLGFCVRKHAVNGVIFVRVDNGWELDELHNVLISSVAAGDLLVRNAGNTLWQNKAQSTLTIAESQVTNLTTDLAAKLPLAGGTMTGNLLTAAGVRIGIQQATPAAALDVGVTRRFTVYPDYVGLGDIPTNTALIGSYAGNLAYFPDTAGGGVGYKVVFGYYNGSTVKSAIEYQNTSGAKGQVLILKGGGNVAIGTTASTALLHLGSGTATASTAPLKFTSGTVLTTPEAGAVEFNTDDYYATITTGAARKSIVLADSALTVNQGAYATTNGRLTSNKRYQIYATGTTNGTAGTSVSLTAAALATSGDLRWIKLTVKAKGANVPPAKYARTLECFWGNGAGTLTQTGSDVLGTQFASGNLTGATIASAASSTNVVITCTDVTGVGATVTWEIFGEYC